jgi:hypothetical protein
MLHESVASHFSPTGSDHRKAQSPTGDMDALYLLERPRAHGRLRFVLKAPSVVIMPHL